MSLNLTGLTPEQLANFQCTLQYCSVKEYGWVEYLPSLPGNILFLVCNALLTSVLESNNETSSLHIISFSVIIQWNAS